MKVLLINESPHAHGYRPPARGRGLARTGTIKDCNELCEK